MKTVFTTGQAAKICKVSQQTIIRSFDEGRLKGFKVPGSKFRRIPRDALYRFMKENNIPMDLLGGVSDYVVLLVGTEESFAQAMRLALPPEAKVELHVANDVFDAGAVMRECPPDAVVLDASMGEGLLKIVAEIIRRDTEHADRLIIALADAEMPAGLATLFNDVFVRPFDSELLAAKLVEAKHFKVGY